MNVGQRMTKNPVTVTPDISVPEAQAIMRREKIRRLPVLDKQGKLVGIVTSLDLIHASPSPATSLDMYELHYLLSKLKVEAVMTKNVITVTEDLPIEEAARIMADNNISGLPVMRNNILVGIITESDLFKLFIELFGARHKGVRLTVLLPERKGELADVAGAIAKIGGNIISLATFEGEDPTNSYCTLKVESVDKTSLVQAVTPLVERIVDIRES
ncbi:MAG TPA: CBS and ACT domain-containing protein [Treponema sp.]|jgi:acetoin utilization protein AcuB|uniref:CBS domain-containing protein n=1 Tax=Gracilinema caldarium TaxID=215591 RepID=A0A7C3IJ02_9SPIR|nr:CBS and ACT domain-containing protein [Gracilinema caldarium]NLJ10495.1 CBS domain-containing protein [Treponema sp.]HON13240.1 CBS and ACT domain-containing protein [Treponema sp.]HPC70516.1 CBS and ACT domain-containing protein [Treponema sp.]HRS03805.1 CBS and ACT domain-containing protein [Treponema sp.]HRU28200.1 CBS and ACT domain-containing protein [Treponema sp.]